MPQNAVAVAGIGLTPVGEHWETSLRHLAMQAIQEALNDAEGSRPGAIYVANSLAPALSRQSHLGALVADFAGLRGAEATTVEAAGASGGVALRQACLAIAAGAVPVAMVLGVEKVTDQPSSNVESALATGSDADYEAVQGVTTSAQAAMLMRRYLHESRAPADALAGFSLTAHRNAVSNPNAMFRRAIEAEQYAHAPVISEPLNTFDAAPMADGAAAVILAAADQLPSNGDRPRIEIAGSAIATGALALHDQPDPLVLAAAQQATQRALSQSGLTLEEIQLFELHDRFTILAALSLEAAGFAPRGEGWKLAQDGAISLTGQIPISTFGGSKARGEPGAATGVYQLAEAVIQLQGRAGENQVADAQAALVQCLGGVGATAASHVLVRRN